MKTSIGYRDQLDRARRFLFRVESTDPRRDVDYQDDVWAFFMNCWHIKDWIENDPLVAKDIQTKIVNAAKASPILNISYDIATRAKHCGVRKPLAFAQHSHTNTTIIPGVETKLDCIIEFDDGKIRSAREVAKKCMNEWDLILTAENLAIGQLS
jgi:hypothetical protein